MIYVIRKRSTREYATRPGSKQAYTRIALKARLFHDYEQACKECRDNETVVNLYRDLGVSLPWLR